MPEARDVTKNEVQDGVQLHEGEVRIVLDGRNVVARKGEKIITAAERAGVFIPRFCYHSRMKPVGVCRMCLVEVTGPRGATLQPACYADVAEGMEIATASDKAKKAQEGVLEFLLINHPLDCPVCDKGGECPLQDQAYSYGPGESRFIDEKRHWAKPTSINSLVLLDRERCIQCSRCTRFAAEVAGEPAIDFVSRGDSIEVGTFPGHAMSPYFSGNIVQICPVGALTAVPFRFSSRPWDTEQVESSCMRCALQCRIAVQSQAGKLSRVLGIDSEPVNHGWLCDKGRFSFEAIYSEERVCEPMIIKSGSGGGTTADAGIGASEDGDVKSRHADGDDDSAVGESGNAGATSGDLVPATWNEALTEVSNRLADTLAARGPSSIAIIGGANLVNEDAYAWVKLAKSVVRTDSVDALLGDGMDAGLLATLDRATIDEACSAKCLLLLCGDLREELPVLYLRVREAAISGSTRLVELSQRPSSLSRYAEISKMYMPGDAPAGVDRLGDAISAMTGASGAGLVVAAGKASMAQGEAELGAAIMSVMARWPAAKFLPVARKANVMGALETGMAPGMLPGGIGLEEGRDRYESAWGALPMSKGLDAHGILEAASHGDIEVLFLLGADPIDDFRDSQLARRALERTPFVVAVDAFETASSRMAHVFLPAALPYEKAGTVTNVEGRVTSVAPKVIPPALAWPEWVVASRLAEAFGADLGFGSQDEIATEMAALVPGWDMLSREPAKSAVLRDGAVIHCQDDDAVTAPAPSLGQVRQVPASLASNACETGGCMDPIAFPGIASVDQQGAPMVVGLVREDVPASAAVRLQGLDPEVLLESQASGYGSAQDGPAGNGGAGAGETRRIAGAAGSDYASPSINQDPRFPLRLVVARTLYGNGTLVGATRSLAPLSVPSRVLVNPEDAPASATRLSPGGGAEVGLGTDGEPGGEVRQPAGTMRVRVISGVGEATLPMEVDESVPKGSVIVQSTPSELVAAADGVTFVRVESC